MIDRFSTLFDFTTVPMCVCNKQAKILEANQAFCEMLKYSEEEVIGKNVIEDFTHPDDKALSREARTRNSYRLNKRYVCKDGEILPLRLCVVKWKNTYLSTMESIQHEINLKKRIDSVSNDLQQITSSISHDLSEPIRTISNYIDLLCGAKDEEAYSIISRNLTLVSKLIRSLMRYSKLGRPDLTVTSISVVDILEEVKSSLSSLIEEKEVKINVTSNCLPVKANEVHVFRLFQNLIHNAIKYSEKPVLIEINCKTIGNTVQFSVKDYGIGIDSRYYSYIFQIFKRLSPDEGNGAGIGLAECKRIVELYGGRIWVESEVGHSSTFYFTLPGKLSLDLTS